MKFLKISFYISNLLLFVLYTFPGSIIGWFIYNDASRQPVIYENEIISLNHIIVFLCFSLLGIFSFIEKLNVLFMYILCVGIILEFIHLIIPNRGFELKDLLSNILGIIIAFLVSKIIILGRNK